MNPGRLRARSPPNPTGVSDRSASPVRPRGSFQPSAPQPWREPLPFGFLGPRAVCEPPRSLPPGLVGAEVRPERLGDGGRLSCMQMPAPSNGETRAPATRRRSVLPSTPQPPIHPWVAETGPPHHRSQRATRSRTATNGFARAGGDRQSGSRLVPSKYVAYSSREGLQSGNPSLASERRRVAVHEQAVGGQAALVGDDEERLRHRRSESPARTIPCSTSSPIHYGAWGRASERNGQGQAVSRPSTCGLLARAAVGTIRRTAASARITDPAPHGSRSDRHPAVQRGEIRS